jgi:hypothetical protein
MYCSILQLNNWVRREFTTHNSQRTIHRGTTHRAQLTAAQFTAGKIPRAQFSAYNSPQHNSPRIIHHEKIKIPIDEFLILLD